MKFFSKTICIFFLLISTSVMAAEDLGKYINQLEKLAVISGKSSAIHNDYISSNRSRCRGDDQSCWERLRWLAAQKAESGTGYSDAEIKRQTAEAAGHLARLGWTYDRLNKYNNLASRLPLPSWFSEAYPNWYK